MSWAKEYHIKLEKQKNNLGQIHHMYSHIYLLSEKGLVFYLYLQKFHMDFSLSTVIFAKANFDKRKFFLRHPVGPNLKSQMRYPCKHYLYSINHQEFFANFVIYN